MMIFVDLLLHVVEKKTQVVSRLGPSAFLDSTRTPKAGADVREFGAIRAATAYGIRQNVVDSLLFTENLASFIPIDGASYPTKSQMGRAVGVHRRRWKR